MKICPKCQSDNVYVSKLGIGYDSCVKVLQDHNWMVSTQAWETHICTDCGYYENYILNKDGWRKLNQVHGRVGGKRIRNTVGEKANK